MSITAQSDSRVHVHSKPRTAFLEWLARGGECPADPRRLLLAGRELQDQEARTEGDSDRPWLLPNQAVVQLQDDLVLVKTHD